VLANEKMDHTTLVPASDSSLSRPSGPGSFCILSTIQ
jgi:hypothetical protein